MNHTKNKPNIPTKNVGQAGNSSTQTNFKGKTIITGRAIFKNKKLIIPGVD